MSLGHHSEVDVIHSAVAKYRKCLGVPYRVTRWPDEEQAAQNSAEIDAYAEAEMEAPLAVEHTRLESFEGQIEDSSKIQRFLKPLEAKLTGHVRSGLILAVPVNVFRRGFPWVDAADRIKAYVLSVQMSLPTGRSVHLIPTVPFPVTLLLNPELNIAFSVARISPGENAIELGLQASMEKALLHKRDRLGEYRAAGARSVLLLESADPALVSHVSVYRAFLRAEQIVGTEHLTDVLLAFTFDPNRIHWYCFLGTERLLACMNLPQHRLGPAHRRSWQSAL